MKKYEPIVIDNVSESDTDDNQHPLMPSHPFRLLITGSSGCGKTNLVINLIEKYLNFDALHVCAKDIFESKYFDLREKYNLFSKKIDIPSNKNKLYHKVFKEMMIKYGKETSFTPFLTDFITVDDLDKSKRNLVIFDDCLKTKDQSIIEEFYIRGRHKNASSIYLAQSYYSTPIDIRKNCDYFIFFELRPKDIQQIIRETTGDLSSEDFKKLYKHCFQKPYDTLMIDLRNRNMRYRRNFEPI